MSKYDKECLELTEMTQEQLLSWAMMPDCPDRLIKEFGEAGIYRLDGTEVDYMVVNIDSLPGVKLCGVWHTESMYHPLYRCESCGRGPLTRDGS